MSYFFLGSVLPSLKFGIKLDLTFEDLLVLLKMNLSKKDLVKVKKIRAYIDLQNVKKLLQKQPLDERGNLNEKELDEALVTREGLPEYLYEYMDEHESLQDQLYHFSKVFSLLFQEKKEAETGFLSFYFNFEREWRLLMTGFRTKLLKRDLTKELQYEDFHDPVVAHLLAQKDSPHFEFPFEYSDFGEQVKDVQKKPMAQYEALMRYRFKILEEKVQDHPFSIDYILAYLLRFMLVQDWNALDKRKGIQELSTLVKEGS